VKILHVHENLAAAGGIETYLLSLIPRLEELGHECGFVFADGNASLLDQTFQVPELNDSSRAGRAQAERSLDAIIRRWQPDVIHLHNVYNAGAVEACLHGAPTVLTGHDFRHVCPASTFYFKRTELTCERTCGIGCFAVTLRGHCLTPRPRKAWQYVRRVQWMSRNWGRFAQLIAPSAAARARFLAAGFPAERARVLPYYCPIESLPSPRRLPERPTVLFLGRISPQKGYKYFIEALGQLPTEVAGLMVGNFNAEKRRQVEQIAADHGCADRLKMRPWANRDEITRLMSEATVLCFSSIWPETLGIVGLEALACGVPVVASDIGGVREWLLPEENGLLVPPRDSGAIAQSVSRLINDPERLLNMGRCGIQLMNKRFSPRRHIDELVSVYQSAAASSKSGQPALQPCAI
jgi:glycosyltransferase involved in cell wall biosynthesis